VQETHNGKWENTSQIQKQQWEKMKYLNWTTVIIFIFTQTKIFDNKYLILSIMFSYFEQHARTGMY
jgi:hypothetical protein